MTISRSRITYGLVLVLLASLLFTTMPAFSQSGTGSAYDRLGLFTTPLYAGQTIDAGTVRVWNSPQKLMIQVDTADNWSIAEIHIYVGYPDTSPLPTTKKGSPIPGQFPYKRDYGKDPVRQHALVLDLKEDLGFSWGS
ncbi:MAG: hypothetical protein JXA89_14900 [Anaerolineae bacterium]|nr:hypothetical protein [Anaerolineae bacterium]